MKAVCFACGREKAEPLILCRHCEIRPISRKDKISSVCLSSQCLRPAKLEKASRYIRQKRKLPIFSDGLLEHATEIVDGVDEDSDQYTNIGLDDSFFDFKGFADKRAETVKVHAIGKPVKDPARPHAATAINLSEGSGKTYQVLEWEVGKEVSIDQVDQNSDTDGDLYVRFVWIGDRGWTWRFISKSDFMQLKLMEQGSVE